ncbi:MAG: GGDEF domain-containing protein, partial [Mariprofundus sp.]|nr:GGDEF domain-containing protein [Mariprofundus sp.]
MAKNEPAASALSLEVPKPVQLLSLAVDVLWHFNHDDTIMAIPVIDELLQPVGLITRRNTLSTFGHKYAYELNSRKTVAIIMDEQPLLFDAQTDIETISRAMTEREGLHAFDPAIMTLNGQYCGLLSVITLLKGMTDIRIELAFDSNPLSRLPGNNSINREIDRRLQQGKAFMLCYIDIDNFKAFNDCYGYERGDRVIQLVANSLKDIASPCDFVGHIGG